jgi:glycosyltransferase involved in cell wall biosynthesis
VSLPDRLFPLALVDGPRVLRQAADLGHVVVLDSIAAAFIGPRLAVTRSHPIPVVGMLHQPPGGIDYGQPRLALQTGLDRLAYVGLARILAASDALAAELVARWNVPADKVRVVPPGRDVAPVATQVMSTAELRQGRQAAFLCVGNWVERKGIHDLLDAFGGLPQCAATLHLVGDDLVDLAYSAVIWRRLRQPALAGRVVVHGPRSLGEVAAFYAASDAFVLASLKEPYGTVYGEAMAAGLPVAGWRAGNLPYLADDEREGLIVAPGDLAGLRAALARLADDEALRHRLGAAGRVRALTRPTWSDTARLFYANLREAISTSRTED